MKRQFSSRRSGLKSESGVYIPLFAIMLVAVITVIGLTTDASKLYVEQLRHQRAADAGAVAGGLLLIQNPRPSSGTIIDVAQAIRDDNLAANGLMTNSPASPQAAPTYSAGSTKLTVTASSLSDTLIMGRWVDGQKQHTVSGVASVTRRPVAVSLILDVTGSMKDPAANPCGDPPLTACDVAKYEALQGAAAAFVSRLDPATDRLSIVWFSTKVANSAEIRPTSHFRKPLVTADSIAEDINTTTLKDKVFENGTTSIAAGISKAIEDFKDFKDNDATYATFKKVAVLITDGSPNVEPITLPGTCDSVAGKRQRAQVAAIRAADLLRDYATVYAIGIGPADPTTTSAFQSIGDTDGDDSYLKTFFMNRVANDGAAGASDKQYSAETPANCIDSYSTISTQAAGESLGTPDGTQLGLLLDRIAQKILLQLVEPDPVVG